MPASGAPAADRQARGPRGRRQPSAAFLAAAQANPHSALAPATPAAESSTPGPVHPSILRQARASGQLNLSGRGLVQVPDSIWAGPDATASGSQPSRGLSLDQVDEAEPWWEQKELTKLILASNQIATLPSQIGTLTSLTTLDLHDNLLESLPSELGSLIHVSQMNLSHNRLRDVPMAFFDLMGLRELNLSHNQLTAINPEIGRLDMLIKFNLCHNQIKRLPPTMGRLTQATHIMLSHNQLVELPSEMSFLRLLKVLDLDLNQLATFGHVLADLTHLELLYARQNQILHFPNLLHCGRLQEIHLGHNLIVEIEPEQLEPIANVKQIDLCYNKLKIIPDEIINLKSLERLDVSNNDLAGLPYALGTLPNLKWLQIEGNPIKTIRRDIIQRGTDGLMKYLRSRLTDDELRGLREAGNASPEIHPVLGSAPLPDKFAMKSSQCLNLAKQEIDTLPDEAVANAQEAGVRGVNLSKNLFTTIPTNLQSILPSLYEMDLSGNRIKSCPTWLGSLGGNLQFINLGNNRLEELPPELSCCSQLRELTIPFNKFKTIPTCVFECLNLETLILEGNQIVEIPVQELAQLKRLAILDLQNNDIGQVPPELGLMTQLRALQIEGNAFRVPRAQILTKGTEAILTYLRGRIPE
eukprot:maker-scaffold1028_size131186-snap-gene-0.53 protein:Tk10638 transcript:maker-scaffold1028_size131186-snap-gene-0.53-mRNA-1 annotation:"hypothetical protein CAPTEDRAFT_182426"